MKKHGDDETGGLLKRESKQENMKKRDAKIKVDKIFLCITLQSNDQLRLYPGDAWNPHTKVKCRGVME